MEDPNLFDEILLVEDNPGDIRLTKEMLKEAGLDPTYHVVTDGTEALDFLQKCDEYDDAPDVDAILLDLHLPRLDGDEVLSQLDDGALSDIPVIAISGSSAAGAVKLQEMEDRVDACVQKPIEPDKVAELVTSFDDDDGASC